MCAKRFFIYENRGLSSFTRQLAESRAQCGSTEQHGLHPFRAALAGCRGLIHDTVTTRPTDLFERLSAVVGDILPADLGDEVRDSAKIALRSACEQLDFVTLEEFEVQQAVLQRTGIDNLSRVGR